MASHVKADPIVGTGGAQRESGIGQRNTSGMPTRQNAKGS